MRKYTAILLSSVILCAPLMTTPARAESFAEIVREANALREELVTSAALPDIAAYTENFYHQLDWFDGADIRRLTTQPSAPAESVTPEQAREDVETFFRIVEAAYGAYHYFGGSSAHRRDFEDTSPNSAAVLTAFESAKAQALTSLDAAAAPIPPETFSRLLAERLGFLQDGHFTISNQRVWPVPVPYMLHSHAFTREADGRYALTLDGETYYATKAVSDFLRPTLTAEGTVGYVYVENIAYGGGSLSLRRALSLTDAFGSPVSRRVILSPCTLSEAEGPAFFESTVQGIPVVTFQSMQVQAGAHEETMRAIAESAKRLQGEPVIILDLRRNNGGNSMYGLAWAEAFTGRTIAFSYARAEKPSPLGYGAIAGLAARLGMADPAQWLPAPSSDGTWLAQTMQGIYQANDTLLFVLMDYTVASSGEDMVAYLQTLDGTAFVGTNTAGCNLTGNVGFYYLPHSGLQVSFGQAITLRPGFENIDATGYQPDFWVNPADALDAVLALIESEGLALR